LRVKHKYRIQYKFKKEVCNSCSLKDRCTNSNNVRIVSFYRGDYFRKASEIVETDFGKKLLRARQIIVEGVIGEAKTLHLLNRCRYRRLEMFKIQLLITASVINLKRLLKNRSNHSEELLVKETEVFYSYMTTVLFFTIYKLLKYCKIM